MPLTSHTLVNDTIFIYKSNYTNINTCWEDYYYFGNPDGTGELRQP